MPRRHWRRPLRGAHSTDGERLGRTPTHSLATSQKRISSSPTTRSAAGTSRAHPGGRTRQIRRILRKEALRLHVRPGGISRLGSHYCGAHRSSPPRGKGVSASVVRNTCWPTATGGRSNSSKDLDTRETVGSSRTKRHYLARVYSAASRFAPAFIQQRSGLGSTSPGP